MKTNRCFSWIVIAFLLLSACGENSPQPQKGEDPIVTDTLTIPSDSIPISTIKRLKISAVGDIMLHDYQMEKAYRNDTDTFDFSPIFQQIQPYLDQSDLLIGNLETVFAGKGKGRGKESYGYGSFPYFNAPDCFAATLAEAGFDWLATANNHTLDSYCEGVTRTLNLLDSLHIRHHGTARDSAEQEALCIIEKDGIKIGLCSYTQSLNGIDLPSDKPFLVNEFRKFDSTKISQIYRNIQRLKASGADFTIAYLHCGTEYQRNPNRYQRRLADSLNKIGCDLILMSHPHILQRMAILTSRDSLQKSLVAYSLGNFLSSQVYSDSIPKDIGAILNIEIMKDSTGTHITEVSVVPTYNYWRKDHIGILNLLQAYNHPDSTLKLYKKDRERINDAYERTLCTLRGKMDSTRWTIGEDRYILKW